MDAGEKEATVVPRGTWGWRDGRVCENYIEQDESVAFDVKYIGEQ